MIGVPKQKRANVEMQVFDEVMRDIDKSPVGGYLASYMVVFIESNKEDDDHSEKRFIVLEDTIIVQADTLEDAYDKVLDEVKHTEPYKSSAEGVLVEWVCEGITEFLPIYEFSHNSEIVYREFHSTN